MKKEDIISVSETATVEHRIFIIRGLKVMIDSDLARLYQVSTMRINEQVKRNKNRFPIDFMFQLTKEESDNLISQIAISSSGYGGRRSLPHVFTEHGVAMLSAVLRSERAVAMSVFIIKAFVKLREEVAVNGSLALQVSEIELIQEKQGQKISQINQAVIQLIGERGEPKKIAGFALDDQNHDN